ncbi:hypothetical protein MASR2M74_00010 [Paracoccaceae bacterium]
MLAGAGLGFQPVEEIDDVEETAAGAIADTDGHNDLMSRIAAPRVPKMRTQGTDPDFCSATAG